MNARSYQVFQFSSTPSLPPPVIVGLADWKYPIFLILPSWGRVVSGGCYLQNTGHNNNKSNFPARILCFNQEKKMLAVIETIAECREQLYSSWSGDPSGGCRSRRTDWEYKWTININILIKYITRVPPPTHTKFRTIIVPGKGGNLSDPVLVWMVCLTFFPRCNERLIVAAGNSSVSERRCRPSIIRSNLTISSSQLTRAKYALTVLHLRWQDDRLTWQGDLPASLSLSLSQGGQPCRVQ